MRTRLWCSTDKLTVGVTVVDGVVVDGAPVVRRFVGQSVVGLFHWLARQGGLRIEGLDDDESEH